MSPDGTGDDNTPMVMVVGEGREKEAERMGESGKEAEGMSQPTALSKYVILSDNKTDFNDVTMTMTTTRNRLSRWMMTALLTVVAMGIPAGAWGVHRCVSEDGKWVMPGISGTIKKYTTLSAATEPARRGDTIWIKDGFICEGDGSKRTDNTGKVCALVNKDDITIRSQSGYVDESANKGAIIRGNGLIKDSNAITPLSLPQSGSATLIGLILENGATANDPDAKGGAIEGGATFKNCIIRNNSAHTGGAFANDNIKCYDCILTNNSAFHSLRGGGVIYGCGQFYNCKFYDNKAIEGVAGIALAENTASAQQPLYSNCVFRANTDAKGYGVATFTSHGKRALFVDCTFEDNTNNCLTGVMELRNCTFRNNVGRAVTGIQTTGTTLDGHAVMTGCAFSNNVATADGGAAYWATATNCSFVANETTGNGGAVAYCSLVSCALVGNRATGYGAAAYNPADATDTTDTYAFYNCLFARNVSTATTANDGMILYGPTTANAMKLYNCTIADNTNTVGYTVNQASLYNSIVWGNATNLGEIKTRSTATYSCMKGLTGEGNVSTDPHFSDDYHLAQFEPCVDAAKTYDWMSAAGDPRGRTPDGHFRVYGDGPDMGCYERPDTGMIIGVE